MPFVCTSPFYVLNGMVNDFMPELIKALVGLQFVREDRGPGKHIVRQKATWRLLLTKRSPDEADFRTATSKGSGK